MYSLSIRLDDDIVQRLQNLSLKTGHSKTFFIRQAIQEHLDEQEDIYLSDLTMDNLKNGKDQILTSLEFWREVEN